MIDGTYGSYLFKKYIWLEKFWDCECKFSWLLRKMFTNYVGEVKANQLQSIYEELNQKGFYTFIQMDLPGFGGSRPPDRDYSPGFFERDAKCAIAFMEVIEKINDILHNS